MIREPQAADNSSASKKGVRFMLRSSGYFSLSVEPPKPSLEKRQKDRRFSPLPAVRGGSGE